MGWQITFNGKKRDITHEERKAELVKAAEAKEVPPSIWQPDIGTCVSVDDLSIEEVKDLANRHDVKWMEVYDSALYEDMDAFLDVVTVCAKHAGIEPPSLTDMGAFMDLYRDGWEYTPNIKDKPMENGFPPEPGKTGTSSRSGSPGTSDGRSTSPAASQSTTS